MPAAIPIHIRHEIVNRHEQGESLVAIAEAMGRSYETVRNIWQHWQREGTLKPNYEACRHRGPRFEQAIFDEAVEMKRSHPRWGAVVIRLKLDDQFGSARLPSVRTLQSWFRQAGVNRSARSRQKQGTVKRGESVHEVWAVDAKERMTLADGSTASWLTITDEASGAILHTEAFPPEILEAGSRHTGQSHLTNDFQGMG